MKWEAVAPAAYRLDAGHGFGHVAGRFAMDKAIKVSQTQGVGLVAVRHSNHYGTAAEYCAQAAEAGCIGLTCTNAFAKVAPFGGKRPVLGTNPLGFGCPTISGVPVLVDMSTAAFAGSSARKSSGAGGQLPPGVALDTDGQPTTDPSAIAKGCLLPAAGPKGYVIALLICVALIAANTAAAQTKWREVSAFKFDWNDHADVRFTLSIPSPWNDPSDFNPSSRPITCSPSKPRWVAIKMKC